MEDGRKFIRYVVPAFIYCIEIILFSAIFLFFDPSMLDSFKKLLKCIIQKDVLSIVIAGFIVSGGLGAIFCHVYHFIYSFYVVDLRKSIIDAMNKKYLNVKMDDRNLTVGEISSAGKRVSLMIDTVLWSQRRLLNKKIEGAEERTTMYHDHMHGVGTVIIATFFAYISWLMIVITNNVSRKFIISTHGVFNSGYGFINILWPSLIIIFFWAYCKLRRQLVFHRYSILMDVLRDDFEWNNKKSAEIEINSIVKA